jgi:hypothetical protein
MTTDIDGLVPFSSGCARLNIPRDTAEKYLRRHPHYLPKVVRVGWGRFFKAEDLAAYESVNLRLEHMAAFVSWWPSRGATQVTR